MGKTCPKCKVTFEIVEQGFHKNPTQRDGWSTYCKSCKRGSYVQSEESKQKARDRARERMRVRRKENPEAEKTAKRRWYQKHKATVAVKGAIYREKNKERVRARARKYFRANRDRANEGRRARYYSNNECAMLRERRRANRDHQRAIQTAYRRANPEKTRFWDKAKMASRGDVGKCTPDQLRAKYAMQGGRCFWCKAYVALDFDVDHKIPISRGGTNWPSNIAISCRWCNQHKHNLKPAEWLVKLAMLRASGKKAA